MSFSSAVIFDYKNKRILKFIQAFGPFLFLRLVHAFIGIFIVQYTYCISKGLNQAEKKDQASLVQYRIEYFKYWIRIQFFSFLLFLPRLFYLYVPKLFAICQYQQIVFFLLVRWPPLSTNCTFKSCNLKISSNSSSNWSSPNSLSSTIILSKK